MSDASTQPETGRKKAFLVECSEPSWLEVAQHLGKAGIDITYWIAWARIRDDVAKICPDALFHDTIDAKRALPLPVFEDAKQTLFTALCRTIWEQEAQTVYEMMIRFDHSRDLIFAEASMHFYQLLLYWNRVLDRMRPDVVIFPTPPHVVYDYVILKLCQGKGIPTLLFEQAWIFPPYSMVMRDFQEGSVELRERYSALMAGPKPVPLSSRGREILDRLAGQYAEARARSEVSFASTAGHDIADEPFWAEQQRFLEANIEIEARWFKKQATQATSEIAPAAGKGNVMSKLASFWRKPREAEPIAEIPYEKAKIRYEKQVNVSALAKQRGLSLAASFEGEMPNKHYLEQRIDQIRHTRERYRDYQARSVKPRNGERFIFLPLMFQPERTSCPQGGIFSNQAIMVNLLSNFVPEGTCIYVKEHPTQLHPNMQSTQARSAEFYEVLAGFKNVRLVDIDADPFALIDSCVAVATVGGTAAMEAVARGKPALVFGYAYYNDCAGIYPVASEFDLRQALAEIALHPKVERADVEAFFHAIETSLFAGNADANLGTTAIDDNAKNIAREIVRKMSQESPVPTGSGGKSSTERQRQDVS